MLEYAIFAVTFVVFLLAAVIYLYPGSSRATTIPGLEPTTEEDGNLSDINRAGSLHEFLYDLHKQFGSIASFWMGQRFVVSIASAELFKQHQNVFDRPPELFKLFEPFFGPQCSHVANGTDGRNRRKKSDKMFSHVALNSYYGVMQDVADELAKKWSTLVKEEHIPLSQYMSAFALKVVLKSLFGKGFDNDKEILEYRRNYDICWADMERSLTEPIEPGSQREKTFKEALAVIKVILQKVIKQRKDNSGKDQDGNLLLDTILDIAPNDEQVFDESMVFTVGGFHTTASALTWCFYFLATHQDVQDKVHEEIKTKLGEDDVDNQNINELVYIKQVLDETLRCAIIAPWAARFQDIDTELGGHKIPKGTPVIHALGVSLHDEKYWPLPNKFDPDRFSAENSKSRPSLAFQPFGFAGKRICPGYRFAYLETTICLVTLLRKFKVNLVDGQVANPVFGLVTHPEEEIWITIEKR